AEDRQAEAAADADAGTGVASHVDLRFTIYELHNSLFPIPCYTRRFLRGRQPLCGMGVTSLMVLISRPMAWRARIADSRPEPGPFTRTSTSFKPWPIAWRAAS